MKIVIGSVRAAHFTGPLDAAASSYYALFAYLAERYQGRPAPDGSQYDFDYFNAVPSGGRPRADLRTLQSADCFLLVIENEFQYAQGKVNPLYRGYLDERLKNIRSALAGKRVVVLNSDWQHTPELIRDYTFAGTSVRLQWLDENDFPGGNLHLLKYYAIRRQFPELPLPVTQRSYYLAYWGSWREDSPERQKTLVALRRQYPNISALYVGHCPPFTDVKWTRQFVEAMPLLATARATLCFGVDGEPTHVTAKYHEAMGLGVIPLLWSNYDQDNTLGSLSWQRVHNLEELVAKLQELADDKSWNGRWKAIEQNYRRHLPAERTVQQWWEKRILELCTTS